MVPNSMRGGRFRPPATETKRRRNHTQRKSIIGSGIFVVQEGQQAVVTQFGRYSHTVDAGLKAFSTDGPAPEPLTPKFAAASTDCTML